MDLLSSLTPQPVFHYFQALCAIPHGSGNTAAISDYCVDFAKAHHLDWRRDDLGNVLIRRDASPGCSAEPLILQAHLDMVCQKDPAVEFDFLRQGLSLRREGDQLFAEGTTLGADDGIGVAMILALLAADVPHPPLEAVLTVDEEVGMPGAIHFDTTWLRGRRMLNLDTENECVLMSGCAGAVCVEVQMPVQRETVSGTCVEFVIDGLPGGHSGLDMTCGPCCANHLMARLLSRLPGARLVELRGGDAYNVIPSLARATCTVASLQSALAAATELEQVFREEYQDPAIRVSARCLGHRTVQAPTQQAAGRVRDLLLLLPGGARKMDPALPGAVCSSFNLGVARLEAGCFTAGFSVRSSMESQKEMLCRQLETAAQLFGGSARRFGDYPGWKYQAESPLRALAADCFSQVFGRQPEITTMHAGLECGIFASHIPAFDCVSIGPEIKNIHTPREALSIASTQRTWQVVLQIVARCAGAN